MKLKDVKIGQKVKILSLDVAKGQIGYIVEMTEPSCPLIRIPNFKRGHDGNSNGILPKDSTEGWWVIRDEIELVEEIPQNGTMDRNLLPTDPKERKKIPIASGVLDYFTAALAEVAKVSQAGNDQHNPGEPLHWARGKSMDHDDTMLRHFVERGTLDSDGQRHSAKMCWRALAILQLELEAEGAPIARGAK